MNSLLRFKFLLLFSFLMEISCQELIFIDKRSPEATVSTGDEINVLLFSDSTSNDHEMIQMAIDYAADNGIYGVFIPAGEYFIDASGDNGSMGVSLRDNISLRLDDSTTLRAIPNDTSTYYVLRVHDVENVKISGGRIFGERENHLGTSGEWGNGIDLKNTSNIRIDSVYVANCWGDGIYIGKGSNFNVQIDGVVCDNNRRQGMSITNADSVLVVNSKFINTNGKAPQAGIDLEPNAANSVSNIHIINCDFSNNMGRGLDIVGLNGKNSFVSVYDCRFDNNNSGIAITRDSEQITISEVEIRNSTFFGINLSAGASEIAIVNSVMDSCPIGVRGRDVNHVNMDSLVIMNYETEGIYIYEGSAEITIVNSLLTTDNSEALGIRTGTSEAIEIGNIEVKGGGIGISSGYDDGVKITTSRIVAISEYPIRLYQTNNSSIEGLYIDSCVSKHTMLLQYSNDNQVSDNTFRFNEFLSDNMYSYILIDNTSHNNVIDNNTIIVDSPIFKSQYGIWLKSATYENSVTGITIDSNAYVVSPVFDQGTGNLVN